MTDAEIGKAVREWVHPDVAECLFSSREEIHRWLDRMRWHVERIAKMRSVDVGDRLIYIIDEDESKRSDEKTSEMMR